TEHLADTVGDAVRLPPDDERLTASEVEDRHYGPAAQGITPAYLRDAVEASPPRPQPQDPARIRETAEIGLDLPPHTGICVLEEVRVVADPRDQEGGDVSPRSRASLSRAAPIAPGWICPWR